MIKQPLVTFDFIVYCKFFIRMRWNVDVQEFVSNAQKSPPSALPAPIVKTHIPIAYLGEGQSNPFRIGFIKKDNEGGIDNTPDKDRKRKYSNHSLWIL